MSKMVLSEVVLAKVQTAISATTGMGSAADAEKKVHLYKNNLDPDEYTELGAFVEADFEGYAAIELAVAVGAGGKDPLSGEWLVRLIQGVNQFFQAGAPLAEPQLVYGIYITDNAGDVLLGSMKFDDPITVDAPDQIVDIPDLDVRFNGSSFR